MTRTRLARRLSTIAILAFAVAMVGCHPLESAEDYPYPDADLAEDSGPPPGDVGGELSPDIDDADVAIDPQDDPVDAADAVQIDATDTALDAADIAVQIRPRGGEVTAGTYLELTTEATGYEPGEFRWSSSADLLWEPDAFSASPQVRVPLAPGSDFTVTVEACATGGPCASDTVTLGIAINTHVSATAIFEPDGSRARPWPTIQQGVDAAAELVGAGVETPVTVFVAAGTYAEYVAMTPGTEVDGGYEPADWDAQPGGSPTTLYGTIAFAFADPTAQAMLKRFTIETPSAGEGVACRVLVTGGTAVLVGAKVYQEAASATSCVPGLDVEAGQSIVLVISGTAELIDSRIELVDTALSAPTAGVAALDASLRIQSGAIIVAHPGDTQFAAIGVVCEGCALEMDGTMIRMGGGAPSIGVRISNPSSAVIEGAAINVPTNGTQSTCASGAACIGIDISAGSGPGVTPQQPSPQPTDGYTCCDPETFPVIIRNNVVMGGQAPGAVGINVGGEDLTAPLTCLDGNRIFAGRGSSSVAEVSSIGVFDRGNGLMMHNNLVHGGFGQVSVGAVLQRATVANNVILGGGLINPQGVTSTSIGVQVEGPAVRLRNNVISVSEAAVAVALRDLSQQLLDVRANDFDVTNTQLVAQVCIGDATCDLARAEQVDITYGVPTEQGNIDATCGAIDMTGRNYTPLPRATNPCVDRGIDLNAACTEICGTPLNSLNGPYRAPMTGVDATIGCVASSQPTADGSPDIGPFELAP